MDMLRRVRLSDAAHPSCSEELYGMFSKEFSFEIGERERHTISFSYNRLLRRAKVQCDGVEIWRTLIVYRGQNPTLRATIGRAEKHELRIDIRSSFIGHEVFVHIDEVLVGEY